MHDTTSAPQAEIDDESPTELKDRWFDQWFIAKGEPLKLLVSSMIGGLDAHESAGKTRHRRRRHEDQLRYEACVEVLVCNLAYAVLNPSPTGRIAYRRGKYKKLTRYDNRFLSPKVLVPVIEKMADMQILTQEVGKYLKQSTIAPTEWFARRARERNVSFADFGRNEREEVVILTRKTHVLTESGPKKIAEFVDYPDCLEADQIRDEVRLHNSFLERAEIDFVDDGIAPKVDPYRRTLTRRFSLLPEDPIRFDQAGRLFGPWWMNLKKRRRANIRIQGEPPAELDFSNVFARLAYARVGAKPPEGDLYDLSGQLKGYQAIHRKGVKLAFNTLLFGGGSRFPTGFGEHLPARCTMPKVRAAIEARHPDLAPFFGTKVGFDLMYQESRILIKVLQALNSAGVVGLGLHDAVLVPHSRATMTKAVMETSSMEVCGQTVPVEIKSYEI